MAAYRESRLEVRGNLHVGVGFLAATSPVPASRRLRFRQVPTALGTVSALMAGRGEPVLLIHGLGATKASFLPTVSALSDRYRCIAMDLPGFGDSDKPLFAAYDAHYFSRWIASLLDALHIKRAHIVGHSLGGRAAIEVGLRHPERVRRLVLMMPSLAWRRNREWAGLLRLVRPEIGLLPLAPRVLVQQILHRLLPEAERGWAAAGKDEFLRSYLTPSGRAAFWAAARQVYLETPEGPDGFWSRLGRLSAPTLFIWGRRIGSSRSRSSVTWLRCCPVLVTLSSTVAMFHSYKLLRRFISLSSSSSRLRQARLDRWCEASDVARSLASGQP